MAKVEKANVVSKKATTVPQSEDNKIINQAETSDTVTIACHLSSGIIFDSLPTRDGGIKSVELPGIHDHLKGRRSGLLIGNGQGGSIAVTLDRYDWENIKRMYGRSALFKSVNGLPPQIMELKGGVDEFDHSDEVQAQITGNAPLREDKIVPEKIK